MSLAITVYCSSATRIDAKHFAAARELGAAIARHGWTLVYGGNDVGPMGQIAHGTRGAGGKVVGITPQVFIDMGVADRACDELIVVESMEARKRLLIERADVILALPGGVGTLEEILSTLVARHLGYHDKPIALIDLDGFYQPLIAMLADWTKQGLVRESSLEFLEVFDSIEACVAWIAKDHAARAAG